MLELSFLRRDWADWCSVLSLPLLPLPWRTGKEVNDTTHFLSGVFTCLTPLQSVAQYLCFRFLGQTVFHGFSHVII